ncbi:MAG: hypothetical protein HYV06_02490 [Deltaproteobacteria bacterium]|nr:hypothetical protein [Deltaproteobacteria bacterium]
MKKRMIVGIAMAMGMLSAGALSASAAGPCCIEGKCSDNQAVRQFIQESAALSGVFKAKEIELRELNAQEGIDIRKADALEEELRELKGRLRVAGEKHGVPPCCIG